jgi:hypothetical protein
MVFIENRRLANQILDTFHEYIMKKRFNLPTDILQAQTAEVQLRNRYEQYWKLLKTKRSDFDLDFFTQQVKYDFLANVLGKDLNYIFNDKKCRQRYGKVTVLFGLYVGEVLRELTNRLTKVIEKYIKTP